MVYICYSKILSMMSAVSGGMLNGYAEVNIFNDTTAKSTHIHLVHMHTYTGEIEGNNYDVRGRVAMYKLLGGGGTPIWGREDR